MEGHGGGSGVQDTSLGAGHAESSRGGESSMGAAPDSAGLSIPTSSNPLQTLSSGPGLCLLWRYTDVRSTETGRAGSRQPFEPWEPDPDGSRCSHGPSALAVGATHASPCIPHSNSASAGEPVPASQFRGPCREGVCTARPRVPLLYHERQEMLLCGMHALNALLQVSLLYTPLVA